MFYMHILFRLQNLKFIPWGIHMSCLYIESSKTHVWIQLILNTKVNRSYFIHNLGGGKKQCFCMEENSSKIW